MQENGCTRAYLASILWMQLSGMTGAARGNEERLLRPVADGLASGNATRSGTHRNGDVYVYFPYDILRVWKHWVREITS